MQIFSSLETTAALERYLEGLTEECVIVDLEQPDQHGRRSTAIGMNLVPMLATANPTTPVIMVGWQTPEAYARDSRWAHVTTFKNVVLRRLPVTKDDILSAIAEVKARLTG